MLSIKRWGQPEENGYVVSYLAPNHAAYLTEQQINVSGGFEI
jgi:3-oxoacyl-[acyl-carrier protein] reductase